MIIGYNDLIACKPLKNKDIKMEIINGFGAIQKETLVELEVVFGDGKGINSGDRVYISQEHQKHQNLQAEISFGKEIIVLLPKNLIKLVSSNILEYQDPLLLKKISK